MIHRRAFLTGLLAAPLVVRSGILMPVRPLSADMEWCMGVDLGAAVEHRITGTQVIPIPDWYVIYARDMLVRFSDQPRIVHASS